MAIAEDASTPAVVRLPTTGNMTTASFSPPSGSLLVALVSGGWATIPNTPGISISDSVGGSWTQAAASANANTHAGGAVKIYTRYLSSAPGSMTVTVSQSPNSGGGLLAVRVVTGAASNQSGAAKVQTFTASATDFSSSITPTASGSRIYAVVDQPSQADATFAVKDAATTSIDLYSNTSSGVVAAAARSTNPTSGSAVTIGWTGASNGAQWCLLEVLPDTPAGPSAGTDTGTSSETAFVRQNKSGTETGFFTDVASGSDALSNTADTGTSSDIATVGYILPVGTEPHTLTDNAIRIEIIEQLTKVVADTITSSESAFWSLPASDTSSTTEAAVANAATNANEPVPVVDSAQLFVIIGAIPYQRLAIVKPEDRTLVIIDE